MFLSKPGTAVFTSMLALAAGPALAASVLTAESAPLDDTALGEVTAPGMGDLALAAWLPDPGGRLGLPPALANIAVDLAGTDHGLVRTILQSSQSTMSLDHRDGRSTISHVVQSATIDLPRAVGLQAALGADMQSGGYGFAGTGQSATNLAVAATLNGAGSFGSIR